MHHVLSANLKILIWPHYYPHISIGKYTELTIIDIIQILACENYQYLTNTCSFDNIYM